MLRICQDLYKLHCPQQQPNPITSSFPFNTRAREHYPDHTCKCSTHCRSVAGIPTYYDDSQCAHTKWSLMQADLPVRTIIRQNCAHSAVQLSTTGVGTSRLCHAMPAAGRMHCEGAAQTWSLAESTRQPQSANSHTVSFCYWVTTKKRRRSCQAVIALTDCCT